jgi:hypothetical protein
MSDIPTLPQGDFNMPPGVRASDIPGTEIEKAIRSPAREAANRKHGKTLGKYWSGASIPANTVTEREIYTESAAQDARKYKWEGWTWKDYQSAIVRQNHRISQLEAGQTEAAKSNKP